MYGYEIAATVHRETDGTFTWREGSLYPNLHKMQTDGLIVGYLEAADLAAAQRAVGATEANTRWQRDMRRFFVSVDGQAPAGDLVLLEPIFNLDDQLGAVRNHS